MRTKLYQLKATDFDISGAVKAEFNDKQFLVWNALPGEEVSALAYSKKRKKIHAVAEEVIVASPDRIAPEDTSYLSSSPWQIMGYSKQSEIKYLLWKDLLRPVIPAIDNFSHGLISGKSIWNYRNKMEYGFYKDDSGIYLSLFKRGRKGKIKLSETKIASEPINQAGKKILSVLNKYSFEANPFKSIILKSSQEGQVIAGIFVKEEKINLDWADECSKVITGLKVYYSNPKSPASVTDKLLYSSGAEYIEDKLGDRIFRHGLLSFFQVNLEVFNLALSNIDKAVDPNLDLIDFYSGVGSISLSLKKKLKRLILVEAAAEAASFANTNINLNNIVNAEATAGKSEDLLDYIKPNVQIILDPPRVGLHQSIVDRIILQKPKRIIYLSCNPETQVRDITQLIEFYEITKAEPLDFFPQTPHCESLVVLELRR